MGSCSTGGLQLYSKGMQGRNTYTCVYLSFQLSASHINKQLVVYACILLCVNVHRGEGTSNVMWVLEKPVLCCV